MRARRSIRLPGYDYTQPGAYFVTISTYEREPLLGAVSGEGFSLSPHGRIAIQYWAAIPIHFPRIELDTWTFMPDHIHAIITVRRGEAFLKDSFDLSLSSLLNASPLPSPRPRGTRSRSLTAVLQNHKSVSTRKINQSRGTPGAAVWQRNYYEHVIRNDEDLDRIRQYIRDNPVDWLNG